MRIATETCDDLDAISLEGGEERGGRSGIEASDLIRTTLDKLQAQGGAEGAETAGDHEDVAFDAFVLREEHHCRGKEQRWQLLRSERKGNKIEKTENSARRSIFIGREELKPVGFTLGRTTGASRTLWCTSKCLMHFRGRNS
jgi:hypothetical protein